VLRIESPPGVDPKESMGAARGGPDTQSLHRNQRAMTLNLKLPASRAVLERLVKRADVVIENYRPDVKYRLGLDYETLAKINARIVLASISGFGQDGPYRDRPGFDQIAQGMSGLMSVTGLPGQGPVRTGAAIADVSAGLWAALGIMTALLEREKSGKGQWVQSSLLNAELNKALAAKTSDEWIETFNKIGVPCGPIYKMNEVFADPQVRHLGAAVEVEHPKIGKFKMLNQPVKLSRTPAVIKTATPELGTHTDEILLELGLDKKQIADLRAKGAV